LERWPIARVQGFLPKIKTQPQQNPTQELVIIDGPPGVPIPIEPYHLKESESSERTSLSIMGLSASHHGLPVLDIQSSMIVGMIEYDRENNEASILWIR
jgi:hypothetical protein